MVNRFALILNVSIVNVCLNRYCILNFKFCGIAKPSKMQACLHQNIRQLHNVCDAL